MQSLTFTRESLVALSLTLAGVAMSRQVSRLVVITLLILPAFAFAESPAPARPNILWLISEDTGPDLACYGEPAVKTPNLDALAARGMRFTHAFTVTGVCSTSRSSFMTGMYAVTIDAQNHRSHRGKPDTDNPLPDGVRLLTHWLKDAGYFTANLRHFTTEQDPKWMHGTGKTDWNFSYPGKDFDTKNDITQLPKNQPFYAQINFSETHRGGDWNAADKRVAEPVDPAKVRIPPYYPDHPVVRADWAQYLDAVQALDMQVGVVLRRLDELKLANNTIIIYIGDHGRAMPRGKQWPYDSGLHIPFILYIPDKLQVQGYTPGKVSDQIIESIDLTATTLALAGVEKPAKMQGKVFLGPNAEAPRQYAFGFRDRGDETVDRIRSVRDARFRYLRNFYPERPFLQLNRYKESSYPIITVMRYLHEQGKLTGPPLALMAPTRPAEELYDITNDPYEINNLARDPKYIKDLSRLRGVLNQWIEDVDDQGRYPELPEVTDHWEKVMHRNYDKSGRRAAARAKVIEQIKATEK